MATTEVEDLPPVKPTLVAHVRDMAGNVWEEAMDVKVGAEKAVLGRAGRPLWPVLLWVGVLSCLVAPSPAAIVLGSTLTLILVVRNIER